jgi:hypothetical protein
MGQLGNEIATHRGPAPAASGEIAIAAESKLVDRKGKSSEPTQVQWMKLSEAPLDFWNAPGEEIYTESDGEPV